MRIFLLLPFSLLFVWHCAREVTLDLPEEDTKIVAVCHFTSGDSFRVKVTLSQQIYDAGAPQTPSQADVTVAINGQFYDRLRKATDAKGGVYWESQDPVLPETPFSLAVQIDGYPRIEASSSVPAYHGLEKIIVPDSSVTVEALADGKKALRIPLELRLDAPPPGMPYFAFNLVHETEVFELVNGVRIPDYAYEASTFFLTDGRTLSLLHKIAEPVTLVNEKFWSDGRRSLYLSARIPFDPATEQPRRIFVEWRTLSEEFYRYHLSLARQSTDQPLDDPDAVFNNVLNGYGNFSGYSIAIDTVEIRF